MYEQFPSYLDEEEDDDDTIDADDEDEEDPEINALENEELVALL